MRTFQRGDSIRFSAERFVDFDGEPVTPSGVTLRISYLVDDIATVATPTMTQSGTRWSVVWDSAVADAGDVSWYMAAVSGSNRAVNQGTFTLLDNAAQP